MGWTEEEDSTGAQTTTALGITISWTKGPPQPPTPKPKISYLLSLKLGSAGFLCNGHVQKLFGFVGRTHVCPFSAKASKDGT